MAKATSIEIAVWFAVVPVIMNMREFQSSVIEQFIVMQLFRQAEHLVGNVEVLKRCNNIIKQFIHSFIFYTTLQVVGNLEPIPAYFGHRVGYTLDRSPTTAELTQRQRIIHAHIHTYG